MKKFIIMVSHKYNGIDFVGITNAGYYTLVENVNQIVEFTHDLTAFDITPLQAALNAIKAEFTALDGYTVKAVEVNNLDPENEVLEARQ